MWLLKKETPRLLSIALRKISFSVVCNLSAVSLRKYTVPQSYLDHSLDIEINLVGRQGYGFWGATLSNLKTLIIMVRLLVTLPVPQLPPA